MNLNWSSIVAVDGECKWLNSGSIEETDSVGLDNGWLNKLWQHPKDGDGLDTWAPISLCSQGWGRPKLGEWSENLDTAHVIIWAPIYEESVMKTMNGPENGEWENPDRHSQQPGSPSFSKFLCFKWVQICKQQVHRVIPLLQALTRPSWMREV